MRRPPAALRNRRPQLNRPLVIQTSLSIPARGEAAAAADGPSVNTSTVDSRETSPNGAFAAYRLDPLWRSVTMADALRH